MIPGLREVGGFPLWTWGSVHPRTGWIVQASEPKAAAVLAQRAADIATRINQPHVYLPMRPSSVADDPEGLAAGTHQGSGAPYRDLADAAAKRNRHLSCVRFQRSEPRARLGRRQSERIRRLRVNLWLPYRCCAREGQLFLGDVEFGSVALSLRRWRAGIGKRALPALVVALTLTVVADAAPPKAPTEDSWWYYRIGGAAPVIAPR